MFEVRKNAVVAGISELRNPGEILEKAKSKDVILNRHNEAVAVLMGYERYLLAEEILEYAEDYIQGSIAKKRDENSSDKDYVDINEW